jgi:hypothetical protein
MLASNTSAALLASMLLLLNTESNHKWGASHLILGICRPPPRVGLERPHAQQRLVRAHARLYRHRLRRGEVR